MNKKILLLFFLVSLVPNARSQKQELQKFTSKKGLYEISYSSKSWQKSNEQSVWDAEFNDTYNVVKAFFNEFDYFVPDENLESTVREQFANQGEIKSLKIYKKKINGLEVDYFELALVFSGMTYNFEGFFYNGQGGAVELSFRFQKECGAPCQERIAAFCSGFKLVKQ
ncbi:hypothetical protein [Flavobacterium silvaticum]|uniref:Uncharacterized protein n=1 Tax=Flavobacterium silvaticum TaxID=1852020 RepID=A0A972FSC3_9FLAO|nr:hypothetical protein [Flavobacterium silvaticum]NMH26645.1 hypothetical protein [Flavobacterium silvaticum]